MIRWQICPTPVTGAENGAWIGVMLASVNRTSTRWINPIMGQTCREKIHLNLVMLSRAVFNSFGPIWGWYMSVGEHSSKGWPWGERDVLGCGHSWWGSCVSACTNGGETRMTKRCTQCRRGTRCVNEPIRKTREAERGSVFSECHWQLNPKGLEGSAGFPAQHTLMVFSEPCGERPRKVHSRKQKGREWDRVRRAHAY